MATILYSVGPYSAESADHTYIHTYCQDLPNLTQNSGSISRFQEFRSRAQRKSSNNILCELILSDFASFFDEHFEYRSTPYMFSRSNRVRLREQPCAFLRQTRGRDSVGSS